MKNNLFDRHGAHVLVDGQYGSTGKGALAAWLALRNTEMERSEWDLVISNAGPNSGHTFYHEGEKHVLKQLPTFAVASHLLGITMPVYMSAGAIIDPPTLAAEMKKYPAIPVFVDPMAAVITQADRDAEHSGTVAAVAGTRSGSGAALARKVLRDPTAIAMGNKELRRITFDLVIERPEILSHHRLFVEVSQGFSLGLNQPFYPKVTSRECTVAQALSDAILSPRDLAKVYMTIRTYPIRVGNVDGFSSGGWYEDQAETGWDVIGVEPERTTVTNRVRRVATFSDLQFLEACRANSPDFVFANFLNYLTEKDQGGFLSRIRALRDDSPRWFDIIGGWGKESRDIHYS